MKTGLWRHLHNVIKLQSAGLLWWRHTAIQIGKDFKKNKDSKNTRKTTRTGQSSTQHKHDVTLSAYLNELYNYSKDRFIKKRRRK